MKFIILASALLSSFASHAKCPDIFSGKFEIKKFESTFEEFEFPASERKGISAISSTQSPVGFQANQVTLTDGLQVELKQKGCDSIQVTALDSILPGITSSIKVTSVEVLLVTETDGATYKNDEVVEWTANSLSFSRSTGKWPNYRKYKSVVTKNADGSIEVKDNTVGCATIPFPIPAVWVNHYILMPIK